MTDIQIETPLSAQLKAETSTRHAALDTFISAQNVFVSREAYARFLAIQFRFHARVAPLYRDARWLALIPDLSSRSRLLDVAEDLSDLGQVEPEVVPVTIADEEGLGWLYVVEGSSLGAAFLLKEASGLGFSAEFGARHLAGSPEGRGLHWHRFKDAIDSAPLNEIQRMRAVDGARAAFASVHADAIRAYKS